MRISKHRKIKRIEPKSYLFILLFIMLLIPKCFTLSRYKNSSNVTLGTDVARWNISVNGEQITNNTTDIESSVKIIPDTAGETQLGPGDTGYFDIEIDPSGTETSIEYVISIDLSHLPTGTKITSCDLTVNAQTETLFVGDIHSIEDTISLTNGQALGSNDIHTYRVHCEIDDDVVLFEDDDFYVDIAIEGQQVI